MRPSWLRSVLVHAFRKDFNVLRSFEPLPIVLGKFGAAAQIHLADRDRFDITGLTYRDEIIIEFLPVSISPVATC